MNSVIIHCDGLCEPNPGGIATYGWRAVNEQNGCVLAAHYGVAAQGNGATNNIAEYRALLEALAWCEAKATHLRAHNKRVQICTDSQLVVQQVNGFWSCYSEPLKPLKDQAQSIIKRLDAQCVPVELTWVPREENAEADELSRQAYREATGHDVPERPRRHCASRTRKG